MLREEFQVPWMNSQNREKTSKEKTEGYFIQASEGSFATSLKAV
jgi:hypothetical protein